MANSRLYKTHDNGGRPFTVKIQGNRITVTQECRDCRNCTFNVVANKIFVGKSPLNPMTEFSGGYGPAFDGNSFLLQFDGDRYVYVGDSVFGFIAQDEIIEFVSPVGNSDVPYPYAVDRQGTVYLLIEGVKLSAGTFVAQEDPYNHYYDASLMTVDEGMIPPRIPKMVFEGITRYYIGSKRYTMTYKPHGGKAYDDIIRRIRGDMSVFKDGKKRPLGREEYAGIMRRFGKQVGFSKLTTRIFIARDTPCSNRGVSRLMAFIYRIQ